MLTKMTLYEEFLSRSTTRSALKKGGNFMGMMTVLMQLRKVCNHPDLFEPRSVVTPFVAPSMTFSVPTFICDALAYTAIEDRLSVNLLQPVWCGSSGLPSIDAALRHDQIESDQLHRLRATYDKESMLSLETGEDEDCPEELKTMLSEVHERRHKEKVAKIESHDKMNRWRCQASPFAFSSRLLNAVETQVSVFQRTDPVELKGKEIILTPSKILELRRNEQQRSDDLDEVIHRFVLCVPPAGARAPVLETGSASTQNTSSISNKSLDEMLLEPLEECLKPYRKAHARLSSFFPDKKLIQFDAGKLQTLAELLRKLKKGGHRALIFTQMSKMLDILEAFLNINGHTYLRLDGSTGVDRRQRMMDRFNNDTKVFCFILSTRSGGMGINLTGADTVIFYDSDWNPAMDAQAQDRAHRIGQTRDVHIYRLITEHTIEENILLKAKQKKNLDIMVMDKGKFDDTHQEKGSAAGNEMKDVYTKGGLRAILGVMNEDEASADKGPAVEEEGDAKESTDLSKEQMEMAMASLEDEDDVKALRGAQSEAAEDLKEFDETVEIKKDSDVEEDDEEGGEESTTTSRPAKRQRNSKKEPKKEPEKDAKSKEGEEQKAEQSELEKEFAAWQTTVGFDAAAIESSLGPMERYGLNFRENIDPFYSIFYINELRRKAEATETQDEIDIEEVEREKAMEERRAMDDGDLLGTRPRPKNLIRQRNLYQRERARLRAEKKRRKLTGENWSSKIDGVTKNPFWYNADTGEAIWDKPRVLIDLEAHELAHQMGWGALPIKPLMHVMDFLVPFPERQVCSSVCRLWKAAVNDGKFVRHVYPVEMGALSRDPSRRDYNHFITIDEAVSAALPGDTIGTNWCSWSSRDQRIYACMYVSLTIVSSLQNSRMATTG
jgi:superfamily II DNA/RNA helicase